MQDKLHEIRVFENFQEELFETGHVIVTTKVVEKSLNSGHLSDQLKIEGLCVHNGKTTKVVEVVITNQEEKILTRATFTMYVTGSVEK